MEEFEYKISNLKVNIDYTSDTIAKKAAASLKIRPSDISKTEIVKRSIDARDKNNVNFVMTINAKTTQKIDLLSLKSQFVTIKKAENKYTPEKCCESKERPVVVGSGPAGLFAALVLAKAGLAPILLERGRMVENRLKDIEKFRKTGVLDTESNVQFGEGGAGTFSDGKLHTGIKDIRLGYVLEEFVNHGAPSEILIDGMPHIGSDLLPDVVKAIREKIKSLGGEVRFGCKFTGFESNNGELTHVIVKDEASDSEEKIKADYCILAVGHSARDTFEMLNEKGISMDKKPFAVGVRIEHRRIDVDRSMYGKNAGNERLGAAPYKYVTKTRSGAGVYTFCMCPGGFVLPASSEADRLCVNGMSCHGRDGENSNSALLVGITPDMIPGNSPLAGINFQRKLEHDAFIAGGGGYIAPVMFAGKLSGIDVLKMRADVIPSYKPGVKEADLREFMPEIVIEAISDAIPKFSKTASFFENANAVLTGVEARSSSPLRINRDEKFNSSIKGLLPCGEGAGYAGGIMSAAVDGIKAAEAVISAVTSKPISELFGGIQK